MPSSRVVLEKIIRAPFECHRSAQSKLYLRPRRRRRRRLLLLLLLLLVRRPQSTSLSAHE